MLLGLVVVPIVVVLYGIIQRRRIMRAVDFGYSGNTQAAKGREPSLRRHLPPVLFTISLIILLIALARPQATVNLPRVEGTVILVFDVSGSMAAQDVEPNRMEAAKAAALAFVLSQPATVQIGIVSFSGSGFAVQTPTNDAQRLQAAIARLEPQAGTSLGQGILVALHTIAVDAGLELSAQATPEGDALDPSGEQLSRPDGQGNNLLAQLPAGPYPASGIVLFSDGENTQSIDPLEAAQAAAEHGVRIDALGFGSTAGVTLELDGFSVHTALDEAALQQIAQQTGGTYTHLQSETDPQAIYTNLSPQLVVKPEAMEITSIFAGAGILISVLGAFFSLMWFNRLP